jgi:AP-4 complex subunit epsilon-1
MDIALTHYIDAQTLRILQRVDPNIVESYYSQSLKAIPPGLSLKDRNEYVTRLLEAIEIMSGQDGEVYAKQLKNLFKVVEDDTLQASPPVLESAVELVLKDTRHSMSSLSVSRVLSVDSIPVGSLFRATCAASLITSIVELEVQFGPTFMVITSALSSEYCGQVSIPPVNILRGLAVRLANFAGELFFCRKIRSYRVLFL